MEFLAIKAKSYLNTNHKNQKCAASKAKINPNQQNQAKNIDTRIDQGKCFNL